MTTTFLGTLLALGLAAGPGLAQVQPQGTVAEAPAARAQIAVRVQNNNFLDVRVYALTDGFTYRLGTVTGLQTSTFRLPAGAGVTGQVQLLFAPIGSRGYWVSQPVLASPGDELTAQVGDLLTFSSVAVR